MQRPFIFKRAGLKIMGTLHIPDKKKGFPGVVLFHGFTGNKIEPHRFFWKISKALEINGIASLRFDYCGCGESEGEFFNFTIKDYLKDAELALNKFLTKVKFLNKKNISVLGFSMGGIVASYMIPKFECIKKLILISAPADPEKVFWGPLKNTIPNFILQYKKGIIDIAGNPVSKKFMDDIKEMEPLSQVRLFKGKSLIIHSDSDEVVPVDNAFAYAKILKKSKKLIMKGENHTFDKVEAVKIIIDNIINFLIKN